MSLVVRRPLASLLAGLLVSMVGSAAQAQATIESSAPGESSAPSPGIAEVALCEMPELGQPAGSAGPFVASIADLPRGAARTQDIEAPGTLDGIGCRLPTTIGEDVFGSGGPLELFATNDLIGDAPGSPGISRVLHGIRETSGKEAAQLLKDERVTRFGELSRKGLTGALRVVCVELEEELEPGDSVVIGTDVKGEPTRRAPSSVADPSNPLANVRDLYHVGRAPIDGSTFVGSTDLATGEYYTGKRPFAALLQGRSACFLLPHKGLGPSIRAVAFRSGQGSDVAGLGASPRIPTDGTPGWLEECIAHALINEPLEFEGIDYLSYGEVDFCFTPSVDDLELLAAWLDPFDDDVAAGQIGFTLREGDRSVEESLPIEVFLEDGRVYFTFVIGYSAYGYHALEAITDIQLPETGSGRLDALFDAAAGTIERALSPVTFAEQAGFLQGTARCMERLGPTR